MVDESQTTGDEKGSGQRRNDWANEAEEALENVGIALREAWKASRGARMDALDSAKKAASALGAAIDQGVAVAKEKLESQEDAVAPGSSTEHEPGEMPSRQHRAPQMRPDEGRGE